MSGISVLRGFIKRVRVAGARVLLDGEGLGGDVRDALLLQEYGFASVPHPDSEGVFLQMGPDASLTIATDDGRYRLQAMAEGEVALYTDEGDYVHLKRGGIEVHSAGTILIDGGDVHLGDGAAEKLIRGNQFASLYNTHTHTDPVSGTTSIPIQQMTALAHLTDKGKVL